MTSLPGSPGAPSVSVVLPTRDRLAFLEASIGSVLSQDHEDLELIVVDDGSTDDTLRYLDSVKDPRLRVLKNATSIGPAAARNRAIAAAAAPLIAFQDSDDVWRPGKLRREVPLLRAAGPACVVAYSAVQMPGIGLIPGPCDSVRSGDLSAVLPRYSIVGLPAAVVRTPALRSAGGFDDRLQRLEDWDLFLALSKLGTFMHIDEVLVDVGVGNDRVSTRVPEYFNALELILEKHADLFEALPHIRIAHELQVLRHALRRRSGKRMARLAAGLLTHPNSSFRSLVRRAKEGSPVSRERCLGSR